MADVEIFPQQMGTLAYWLADDGAAVEEGDKIASVECMKVEFPVYAPASGTLRHRLSPGEVAGQDDALAVIETDDTVPAPAFRETPDG